MLPSVDDCHCILPVFPIRLTVVVEPAQIDDTEAVAVPPTLDMLNVTCISLADAVHGELEIVQRNVYAVPAVPLNVDVGLDAVPNEPPEPLTMLHAPVPALGVLAARVTCVRPQVDIPV